MKRFRILPLLALFALTGCPKKKHDPAPPQLEGGQWEYQGGQVTFYNPDGSVSSSFYSTPTPQTKFYDVYTQGTLDEYGSIDGQLWFRVPYTRNADKLDVHGDGVNTPKTIYDILSLDEHQLKLRYMETEASTGRLRYQSDMDFTR